MSTGNKRNVFIGFAVFAVIVVAVLVIWRPPALRNEDASGAIGAVQKHRQPQITQQDVILGDEATRQEQDVLYADFLNDSATLQSISNELDSKQANMAASKLLAASDELQARYARSAQRFADAANKVAARENNLKLASDVAALSSMLGTKLSESEMSAINAKVAAITAAAGARSESHITVAQSLMNGAIEAMQSRNGSMAAAKLGEAAGELSSHTTGLRLADHADYLEAIRMEARALNAAQSKVAANKFNEASTDLASQAIEMESRGVNNLAMRMSRQAEIGSRLDSINSQLANADRLASSQASMFASRADNISSAMAGVRAAYARASSEYAAKTASAISLNVASLQNYLNSRPQAASRLDAKLEARTASNRSAMAKSVASMRDLANRPEVASKVNQRVLGDADALQSRLAAKSN